MILMNGSGIKKMFLDETLFDGVSFSIDSSDKIGFVGINGAGKSTLFKIITGQMDYDDGEIFKNKLTKIGYLDQYACSDSENTIMDEMLGAFSEVIDIEQQLDDIRFDIESGKGDIDALVLKQTRLQERFEELDGFSTKVKLKVLLKGWDLAKRNFLCVSTVCQEDKRQELLWVRYFFPMQIYCCLMSLQIILILSRLNGLRAFYRAVKQHLL